MNLDDYQNLVDAMPLYDDPALGLPGEVGEVLEHIIPFLELSAKTSRVLEKIKKDRRPEPRRKPVQTDEFAKEVGDVLWYLTRVASLYGLRMSDVAEMNIEKLNERHAA